MTTNVLHPPTGFTPWARPSPMLDRLGDLWCHTEDRARFGFHVDEPKLNARGLLHGGAVSTIADVTTGHFLAAAADPPTRYVTIGLEVHFLGTGTHGDWVEVAVTSLRRGSRLAVGTADFHLGNHRIAHATVTFIPT